MNKARTAILAVALFVLAGNITSTIVGNILGGAGTSSGYANGPEAVPAPGFKLDEVQLLSPSLSVLVSIPIAILLELTIMRSYQATTVKNQPGA